MKKMIPINAGMLTRIVTLLLCVYGATPGVLHAKAAGDEAGVRSVLSDFEAAWNRHDMDAFARLFAEDADFVNVLGMRWIGRAAIMEAYQATHTTIFKNSQLRIGETSVRFLKRDVAVARSVWELEGHTSPVGEPQAPRKGILTNVLAQTSSGWQIVITQNTDIVAPKP
jgi:uncharacterized protein (TIGR02246 family)